MSLTARRVANLDRIYSLLQEKTGASSDLGFTGRSRPFTYDPTQSRGYKRRNTGLAARRAQDNALARNNIAGGPSEYAEGLESGKYDEREMQQELLRRHGEGWKNIGRDLKEGVKRHDAEMKSREGLMAEEQRQMADPGTQTALHNANEGIHPEQLPEQLPWYSNISPTIAKFLSDSSLGGMGGMGAAAGGGVGLLASLLGGGSSVRGAARGALAGGGAGVGASLAGTHLTPILQQYGIEDPNVAKAIAGLLGATAGGIGGYGLGGLIPGGEDEEEQELARRRGARRPRKLSLASDKAAPFDNIGLSEGQSKLADVLSRVINGDSGLEQIIERLKTAKTKYKKGKKKTTSCK